MHDAQQIGRKHEATGEDRDHQQPVVFGGDDFTGQRMEPFHDHLWREDNLDSVGSGGCRFHGFLLRSRMDLNHRQ